MIVRVVNVRDFPNAIASCVYVGRYSPRRYVGHALANPFKLPSNATEEQKRTCIAKYEYWLNQNPELVERELAKIREIIEITDQPLGCWCAWWNGISEPAPLCHAVVLAKRLRHHIRRHRHAKDMERFDLGCPVG